MQISYKGEALRSNVKDVVDNLAETILEPMLRYWEVKEEKVRASSLLVAPGSHRLQGCV